MHLTSTKMFLRFIHVICISDPFLFYYWIVLDYILIHMNIPYFIYAGKWQPTPVFLPGKSYGQKSLVGYSPWGHKELDMNERLSTSQVNGRFDCLYILCACTMTSTAMIISIQVFVCTYVFIPHFISDSLGVDYMSCGIFTVNVVRKYQTVFQSGCTIYIPIAMFKSFIFSTSSPTLVIICF